MRLIEKLKPVISPVSGKRILKDVETGRNYRRVSGGVAWPYDIKPGAVAVLAEDIKPVRGTDHHRVEVVAEFLHEDHETLCREMANLQDMLQVEVWRTPLNHAGTRLVQMFNERRQRLRLPCLDLVSPPAMNGSRTFRDYDRLVDRRTRNIKTLHFGQSQAVLEYNILGRDDLGHKLEEFPPVAAVLYALAGLDLENAAAGFVQDNYFSGMTHSTGGY
ncbi:hypothetical protein [Maridesulfovibrio bastinii]|uniref:hypothetical protein n=1 Tax=Maridesulfovibrio bastinii TaxID=47157 RepID=UPI0012EBC799|nr:hypothetical protein [Maridesulfovibrio bastinii]